MVCLSFAAWARSLLGCPDQVLHCIRDALTLTQALSHPYHLVLALDFSAIVHHLRHEGPQTRERVEAVVALARERTCRSGWQQERVPAAGQCYGRDRCTRPLPRYTRACACGKRLEPSWHGYATC